MSKAPLNGYLLLEVKESVAEAQLGHMPSSSERSCERHVSYAEPKLSQCSRIYNFAVVEGPATAAATRYFTS